MTASLASTPTDPAILSPQAVTPGSGKYDDDSSGGSDAPGGAANPGGSGVSGGRCRATRRSFTQGLLTNKKALAGTAILLLFIALALLAPVLFPDNPSKITGMASEEPSAEHWLGTTAKGQDVLALTIHGARSSLLVGLTVGLASTLIGIVVGLASAYFGKFVDEALSVTTNVFLLLPGLPLLVVLAAFLPPGLGTVIVVLIVTGWAGSARVLRSQALSIRSKDFVAAAVVSGEGPLRIMFREILPNMASNVMSTLLGCVIFGIGAQAGLEFLGLGDVSTVSWGTNLYWAGNEGALLTGSWWVFVPSGLCIALVAFALALINYAVDEVTNPRLRKIRAPKDRVPKTAAHKSGSSHSKAAQ
ncbi:ABC transporter permease [Arthrobacter sp. M4]|uniref:ABC transporter permease n=1 Tax=Arthrobacter sp. M4 TaxID=218160 RepID=UPI001CDC65DD|nr:ABC transporter permease [Arthrobacter sp. M4]MCA4134877.1 ABC transporter permease [Arthrobacter sp. M4]